MKKRTRKSVKYQLFHFYNGLCKNDFIRAKNITVYWFVEIFTAIIFFFIIFIIPFLFT